MARPKTATSPRKRYRMRRKIATTSRPMAAAHNAWWSELLPSVAETSVCESRVKVYGSEPLWRTSAVELAASAFGSVIWALPAMPCERSRVRVVDVRRLLELAVEHDRVMAGIRGDRVLVVRVQLAGLARVDPATVVLVLGDPLELVRAMARELERHDRRAGVRVDIGGDARLDEVLARQRRGQLEQVPVLAALRAAVRAGAEAAGGRDLAGDGLGVGGHLQHLRVRRLLPVLVRQQQLLATPGRPLQDRMRGLRPRDLLALDLRRDLLFDGLEQVVRLRRALVRLRLHCLEQAVERRNRRRLLVSLHGRRQEARLEVEHLELAGRADGLRGLGRVVDAGELDHDLVPALDGDVRRDEAARVGALGDDLLGDLHLLRVDALALLRNRAEDDLEAALQVEAERRLLVQRRAGNGEQHRADEERGDRAQDQEVVAAFSHEGSFKTAEKVSRASPRPIGSNGWRLRRRRRTATSRPPPPAAPRPPRPRLPPARASHPRSRASRPALRSSGAIRTVT